MSRRESAIKAVAGALQAQSLDLTKYRQRSSRDPGLTVRGRTVVLRGDEAAGALAFASLDQHEGLDGKPTSANDPASTTLPGDPLPALLLRLKYAEQPSRALFQSAHLTLLHRYGGLDHPRNTTGPRKPSVTLFAVAFVALFEWMHDDCPKCRARRAKNPKPGMRCVACRNSGRIAFPRKERWKLVNEFICDAQRQDGRPATGIGLDAFSDHWMRRYYHFLEVLQAADRRMAAGLDFGLKASTRSA